VLSLVACDRVKLRCSGVCRSLSPSGGSIVTARTTRELVIVHIEPEEMNPLALVMHTDRPPEHRKAFIKWRIELMTLAMCGEHRSFLEDCRDGFLPK
jgi:hypothetical protein